jgi:hypothetical protein
MQEIRPTPYWLGRKVGIFCRKCELRKGRIKDTQGKIHLESRNPAFWTLLKGQESPKGCPTCGMQNDRFSADWSTLYSKLVERPDKTAIGKTCLTMFTGIGSILALGNG